MTDDRLTVLRETLAEVERQLANARAQHPRRRRRLSRRLIGWLTAFGLLPLLLIGAVALQLRCDYQLDNRKAFATLTRANGWFRSQGKLGDWTAIAKHCESDRHKPQVYSVDDENRWASRRFDSNRRLLKVIEDEVRGIVVKVTDPAWKQPLLLDRSRCKRLSAERQYTHIRYNGLRVFHATIEVDCPLEDGRFSAMIQLRNCNYRGRPGNDYWTVWP